MPSPASLLCTPTPPSSFSSLLAPTFSVPLSPVPLSPSLHLAISPRPGSFLEARSLSAVVRQTDGPPPCAGQRGTLFVYLCVWSIRYKVHAGLQRVTPVYVFITSAVERWEAGRISNILEIFLETSPESRSKLSARGPLRLKIVSADRRRFADQCGDQWARIMYGAFPG